MTSATSLQKTGFETGLSSKSRQITKQAFLRDKFKTGKKKRDLTL